MAQVNQVSKKTVMSVPDIVKYQILTYCFLNDVHLSEADIDCVTYLALSGEDDLTVFCKKIVDAKIFKSSQSVRNAITKIERKNIITKDGKNKKKIKISINKVMNIITEGPILLNYNFLGFESNKS
jgi:hypothetical protein